MIGGGDSAFEEALYLSHICSKVTIIHRRDKFRSSAVLYQRALVNPKVNIVTNSVVLEWLPEANMSENLGGALVKNIVTGLL